MSTELVTVDVVYTPSRSWHTLWLAKRSRSLTFSKETTRALAREFVVDNIGVNIESGTCAARLQGESGWVETMVPDGWTVRWAAES